MTKVLLFGNLGSGKIRLAAFFIERNPEYAHVGIDGLRRRSGDGTMAAEQVAKQQFINAVLPDMKQVIEATGTGDTAVLLANRLRSMREHLIIVILTTPLDLCIDRLARRIWDVPYPAPPEMAIDLARRTDAMIKDGSLDAIWADIGPSVQMKGDCSTDRSMYDLIKRIEHHLHP